MPTTDKKHLRWMRDSLVHARREDGEVDNMERLRRIIRGMPEPAAQNSFSDMTAAQMIKTLRSLVKKTPELANQSVEVYGASGFFNYAETIGVDEGHITINSPKD